MWSFMCSLGYFVLTIWPLQSVSISFESKFNSSEEAPRYCLISTYCKFVTGGCRKACWLYWIIVSQRSSQLFYQANLRFVTTLLELFIWYDRYHLLFLVNWKRIVVLMIIVWGQWVVIFYWTRISLKFRLWFRLCCCP